MSVPRTTARRRRRTLVAAAVAAAIAAATGGWAAGSAQTAVTGPAPGAAAWRADHALGVRLPDPASAEPADVARFFASLTGSQRHALAVRHPLTVGNLDGAPVTLRYEANALALRAERRRQLALAEDPAATLQDHSGPGRRPTAAPACSHPAGRYSPSIRAAAVKWPRCTAT